MKVPNDPFETGLLLARLFDKHGISYALGGALAYGLWAIPRATIDVDVNVFVDSDGLDDLFAALRDLGISLDEAAARAANGRDGMFMTRLGPYRIDIFTPSIPFSREAERTKVVRDVEGERVWFLSAEALAVFKLLFFRPKDIVDLQRLVAVQGERLDTDYVRQHVADMLGENDDRVEKWDELVHEHGSAERDINI